MQTYPRHNLYDALGVPRFTADEAELKKGYRRQISKYHTDKESNITALGEKHPGLNRAQLIEKAKKQSQAVLEAWDILKSSSSRAAYDAHLLSNGHRRPPQQANSNTRSTHQAHSQSFNQRQNAAFEDFFSTFKTASQDSPSESLKSHFNRTANDQTKPHAQKSTMQLNGVTIESDGAITMTNGQITTKGATQTTLTEGRNRIVITGADIKPGFMVSGGTVEVNRQVYKSTDRYSTDINLAQACPPIIEKLRYTGPSPGF